MEILTHTKHSFILIPKVASSTMRALLQGHFGWKQTVWSMNPVALVRHPLDRLNFYADDLALYQGAN